MFCIRMTLLPIDYHSSGSPSTIADDDLADTAKDATTHQGFVANTTFVITTLVPPFRTSGRPKSS
jgi:hypothetical protein